MIWLVELPGGLRMGMLASWSSHRGNAVVALAAGHGIVASGRREAPGVYVAAPTESIGLRVRRGCQFHGLALNVDMDLRPFSHINPCGMAGLAMTQLVEEGARTDVAAATAALAPLAVAELGLKWDGGFSGAPGAARCSSATSTTLSRCWSSPGQPGQLFHAGALGLDRVSRRRKRPAAGAPAMRSAGSAPACRSITDLVARAERLESRPITFEREFAGKLEQLVVPAHAGSSVENSRCVALKAA